MVMFGKPMVRSRCSLLRLGLSVGLFGKPAEATRLDVAVEPG